MEENFKNKAKPNYNKLLLLKKIKLKNFPELSKNIKNFFWSPDKYFQYNYKNYDIVVGNKDNRKTKMPLTTKRKLERRKTRKVLNNSSDKKLLNDSKMSLFNNSNTSRIDKKRGITKNIKETGLKIGQKYINDFELEDLFNAFKKVHKLNKKKIKNFIMAKEYINNNTLLLPMRTLTSFGKLIFENKTSTSKDDHKILPNLEEEKAHKSSSKKNNINNFNTINNDYYKTASTFMSINNNKDNKEENIFDSPSRNNNNLSSLSKLNLLNNPFNGENNKILENKKAKTANNFFSLKYLEEKKNIISRNNIIAKQNQFLLNSKEEKNIEPNKTQRVYLANLLANQEQTIVKRAKNKLKINGFYNIISKKSHKSKDNLLMTNIDSYRIKNELKDNFNILNSKIEPEHFYNWKKDLRESQINPNIQKNITPYNINSYNIRDPYYKGMHITISNKSLGKKKNNKYYRNLIDETNKINNNFKGLYIKGKNLLKIEYDQIKSLKNRKIINNYEIYLPTIDVEDILFTDNKYMNNKKNNNEKI